MKKVFQIDGGEFDTLEAFFEVVGRTLVPGAAWGHNLDAFNDILRGGFGTPETGFVIRWRNAGASRKRLGHAETVRQLRARLERCHPSNRKSVEAGIAAARAGRGSTVFDWLVEIILDHGEGGSQSQDGVELELVE